MRQRRGFEELDAIELAAYAELRAAVGPKRAKSAWRDLRASLQGLLLDSPSHLWMVIEVKGVEGHVLAGKPTELAKQVAHGRPVVVVDLRRAIAAIRTVYRDAVSRKRPVGAGQLRRLKHGS